MEKMHYRVVDSKSYAKSGEVPRYAVCAMIQKFISILGSKQENIYVEEVETGRIISGEEFLAE